MPFPLEYILMVPAVIYSKTS